MLEPNEYIRKYGIEQAKEYYKIIKNKPMYSFDADMPRKYKEMIESHYLVRDLGGIKVAKEMYEIIKTCIGGYKLKQAIADVESCQ